MVCNFMMNRRCNRSDIDLDHRHHVRSEPECGEQAPKTKQAAHGADYIYHASHWLAQSTADLLGVV